MREEYVIIKFWHPSSGKDRERYDDEVYALHEAQAICEEGDYKEGPQSEWYFLGYMNARDW